MIQQLLEEKLYTKFLPYFLQIENESHMHSSGRGSDSHFKIVIVSECFEGMKKVARHQMIYQLLVDELKNGIHALALHTYTEQEWNDIGRQFPMSPNCLGQGN